MAALCVGHHALGFGMVADGFTAYRVKPVNLLYLPAFGIGVKAGALLVVLRALAAGLVFGRDANPYADVLCALVFFHPVTSPIRIER